MKRKGSDKKVANSLVAASSAAVLAVYAAGYAKTQSAAGEMDQRAAVRRPRPSMPIPAAAPPTQAAETVAPGEPKIVASVKPVESHDAQTPVASEVISAAPAPPVVAMPEAPAPVAPPVTTPAPAPAATVAAATPDPPAVAKAPPAHPDLPPWKDGKYEGWGYCRHGDIQAAVVVEGGRIVSATIAQCLTRYSCDIIKKAPVQVVERQSPNVDYVSGATQSVDAFYYAVVDALSKAK